MIAKIVQIKAPTKQPIGLIQNSVTVKKFKFPSISPTPVPTKANAKIINVTGILLRVCTFSDSISIVSWPSMPFSISWLVSSALCAFIFSSISFVLSTSDVYVITSWYSLSFLAFCLASSSSLCLSNAESSSFLEDNLKTESFFCSIDAIIACCSLSETSSCSLTVYMQRSTSYSSPIRLSVAIFFFCASKSVNASLISISIDLVEPKFAA